MGDIGTDSYQDFFLLSAQQQSAENKSNSHNSGQHKNQKKHGRSSTFGTSDDLRSFQWNILSEHESISQIRKRSTSDLENKIKSKPSPPPRPRKNTIANRNVSDIKPPPLDPVNNKKYQKYQKSKPLPPPPPRIIHAQSTLVCIQSSQKNKKRFCDIFLEISH